MNPSAVLAFVMQLNVLGSCPLVETNLVSTGWTGSAAIQERAQERGIPEYRVGAVAILWRHEACDLLSQNTDLLAETRKAIESECQLVIFLPESAETTYVAALRSSIAQRRPDLVTLAWAHDDGGGDVQHVFLVADGSEAVRVVSAGYGRGGKVVSTCESSPWALASGAGP